MFPAIRESIRALLPPGQPENKALLFNRLCRGIDDTNAGERDQKEKALQGLVSSYSSQTLKLYKQALTRWQTFLRAQPDILTMRMEVVSPMVVGKGDQNVHEFGMTLQSPWGTPILPGSAVKGVLSSFTHAQGGPDWQKSVLADFAGQYSLIMFGGVDQRGKLFAGALDFLDAWWLPGQAVPFTEDIITVHNSTWYQDRTDHAPTNWPDGMDSPIPNHFAVVRPGEHFLFAVRGTKSWRELAKKILVQAASSHGFGAKTKVGYGRLGYIQSSEEVVAAMPAMSDADLANLFQAERGNQSLRDAFSTETNRRSYSSELHRLFSSFRPSVCMLEELKNHTKLDWRTIRLVYEQYKKILEKKGISPEEKEIQTIFQICLPLAPKGWEQSWLHHFAPSARQLLRTKTADEIAKLLKNYELSWPPFTDFEDAIKDHQTLDPDEKDILLLDFFPERHP